MGNIKFGYFGEAEADQYNFYRVPKALFKEECFQALSCEAKILYGLMLDRVGLSIKNQWFDSQGRAYIIFTVADVMGILGCRSQKAVRLMKELDTADGIGLIEKKRVGLGRPNIIYVKNFMARENGGSDKTNASGNGFSGDDPSASCSKGRSDEMTDTRESVDDRMNMDVRESMSGRIDMDMRDMDNRVNKDTRESLHISLDMDAHENLGGSLDMDVLDYSQAPGADTATSNKEIIFGIDIPVENEAFSQMAGHTERNIEQNQRTERNAEQDQRTERYAAQDQGAEQHTPQNQRTERLIAQNQGTGQLIVQDQGIDKAADTDWWMGHGENPVMMELEEDDAIQAETDWWMQETHSADVAFDNQKSALQGNGSDIDGFGAGYGKQGRMAPGTAYADRVNNVDNWREESGNRCENQNSVSAAACFTDGMPGAERKSAASSGTDGSEAAEWTSEGVSVLENRTMRGTVERNACKAGSREFMDKEVEAMWRSAFERTSDGECGAGLGQPDGAGPEFSETAPLCGEMRDFGFVTGKAAGFWNSECNDTDTSDTEYISKTGYMENNADDIEFYNINQSYQSYQSSRSYQSCQSDPSGMVSWKGQPEWKKECAAHGEMGLDGQRAQSREWNLPKNQETSSMENKMDSYREIIRDNISYACFQDRAGIDDVDELVELMVDTMMVPDGRTVRVGGQDRPASIVKGRFMKLAYSHIEYVMGCLQKHTGKIWNIKAYLLTALYNSTLTIGSYYRAEVNHDLYGAC